MTQVFTMWVLLFSYTLPFVEHSSLQSAPVESQIISYNQDQIGFVTQHRPLPQDEQQRKRHFNAFKKAFIMTSVCTACCVFTPAFLGTLHGFFNTHIAPQSQKLPTQAIYNKIISIGLPKFFATFYTKGIHFGETYYSAILQMIAGALQTQATVLTDASTTPSQDITPHS